MLYGFLWWSLKLFIQVPFRLRWVGRENVPGSGGVVLAGNHESYLDPVIMAMGIGRNMHFMAKSELWRNRVLGWLVEQVGTFPVNRAGADRAAIQRATAILEAGELVGIFPQGTRRHTPGEAGLREGAGGAALIAMRAGAPVVPVGIYGSDRIRPEGTRLIRLPRLVVVYGEPVDPASVPGDGRRERMDALTRRIMDGIGRAHADAARVARGEA